MLISKQKKIRDDKSYTNYGKQISGVTDYSVSTYNTLLKNKNKKDIEKFKKDNRTNR